MVIAGEDLERITAELAAWHDWLQSIAGYFRPPLDLDDMQTTRARLSVCLGGFLGDQYMRRNVALTALGMARSIIASMEMELRRIEAVHHLPAFGNAARDAVAGGGEPANRDGSDVAHNPTNVGQPIDDGANDDHSDREPKL